MMKTISKPKDNSKLWRDSYYHKLFGLKAAQEAEQVLPIFEKERPEDDRPRKAIEAIRAWAQGNRELGMAEVRKLSLDSHAAARATKSDAARYAARAAGQAVATWHVPTHAMGAPMYAGKAVAASKSKSSNPYVHKGFGSVRPYLHGPSELPNFLEKTFDAQVIERHEDGPTLVQIGDSLIWVEPGKLPAHVTPWVCSVYVYVEDVDKVYARAIELGAKGISAPEDKPFNERQAGFIDGGGNTWWVSRYAAASSLRRIDSGFSCIKAGDEDHPLSDIGMQQ